MESDLQNGLRVRQATKNDIAKVAAFNGRIHAEDETEIKRLEAWTADLMGGMHPTTQAKNFLIVETESGEIASSTGILPQVWYYEDVAFSVGRPELVGTDEAWRKKGLVREQFKVLHQLSERNGDLMQVITGIPWYYRKFGYSHALDLGGARQFNWDRPGNYQKVDPEKESYQWRAATSADIPSLQRFYKIHGQNYLINSERNDALWRFIFDGQSPESIYAKSYWIITDREDAPVGFVGFALWPTAIAINEIACDPGLSMRDFSLYITRAIHDYADGVIAKAKADGKKAPLKKLLLFYLGQSHLAYDALGIQLNKQTKSYAWYIRIPDIPAFLMRIKPVLDRRISNSVMAGHSGNHKVNLYQEQFELVFKDGALKEIKDYERKAVQDGHTSFTRPEFIQLICGHKSFEEINNIHVDCYGNAEAWVLMNVLFPKRASNPMGVW